MSGECKFNEHYLILKLICRQYFVKFKTSFMWTHLITSLLSYVDHQLVKKCSDEKFRLSVSFKMHHIFFSSLFSFHSLQIHSLFNNFEIDYVPKQERKASLCVVMKKMRKINSNLKPTSTWDRNISNLFYLSITNFHEIEKPKKKRIL